MLFELLEHLINNTFLIKFTQFEKMAKKVIFFVSQRNLKTKSSRPIDESEATIIDLKKFQKLKLKLIELSKK